MAPVAACSKSCATPILGEWMAAQRRAVTVGEAGAEQRLLGAEHLRGELTKIIDGDPPDDTFVRWKPLHCQPIGWEPDIDDGVRLNIRPFLTAKPRNPGRRDACILRITPRVKKHAGADRGADPIALNGLYVAVSRPRHAILLGCEGSKVDHNVVKQLCHRGDLIPVSLCSGDD
jgi:hypothetical protein